MSDAIEAMTDADGRANRRQPAPSECRLAADPGKGRGVFARRDLKQGLRDRVVPDQSVRSALPAGR